MPTSTGTTLVGLSGSAASAAAQIISEVNAMVMRMLYSKGYQNFAVTVDCSDGSELGPEVRRYIEVVLPCVRNPACYVACNYSAALDEL